jgi:hypothetical protein
VLGVKQEVFFRLHPRRIRRLQLLELRRAALHRAARYAHRQALQLLGGLPAAREKAI